VAADSYELGGHIVTLSEDRCRDLLGTTTVGRIAFVDDDGQQLVPVNFAYLDGAIYFRTLADGFLSVLVGRDTGVAFGIDHHDDMYRGGWNVTVKGTAERVDDQGTIDKVLAHPRLLPWAGGTRPLVMRVTVDSIAGRKVTVR
jgi:nitroimidazol reductase NimA-like FMN-containing flavoprotein (pyridoxamine 5'-phosphate oxidase superfamily)